MAAEDQPIRLDIKPTPTGCTCPVCGQALSYESPGRYQCDICESAYAEGKTIEAVRLEVEDLARSVTAMFSGDRPTVQFTDSAGRVTGIMDLEPSEDGPPHLEWPAINEEARRWQDDAAPSRRDHFVAELHRLIRLGRNRPFRGHKRAYKALEQVARQHLLTERAKRGHGPRKKRKGYLADPWA